MRRSRLLLPLITLAVFLGAIVAVALGARASSASAPTISVTAGVPHELSFKVSPAWITWSPLVFKVTNKGKLPHSFKFCTTSSAYPNVNSCKGVATKMIAPGGTATLNVTLPGSGNYEYLSTKASQAAAGMKGFVIVRLRDTDTDTASGPGSGSGGTSGGVAGTGTTGSGSTSSIVAWGPDGEAPDPACPPGVFIAFTGAPGANVTDQDDDNEGGFATDHDGCV